jgi:hypothetical protein
MDSRGVSNPLTLDLPNQPSDGDSKPIATLHRAAKVLSAAFFPDSRCILTTCRDATAQLWDGHGRPLATTLQGQPVRYFVS